MIYIASPYSSPDPTVRQERYEAVCRYAAKLIEAGELVFSPIAHSHVIPIFGDLDTEHEYWQANNRQWLRVCDCIHVLMIDGWVQSTGVQWERNIARAMGIKERLMLP